MLLSSAKYRQSVLPWPKSKQPVISSIRTFLPIYLPTYIPPFSDLTTNQQAIRRDLAEKQAAVISSIRKFLDEYLRGYGATNMMENGGLAAGQLDAVEISNEALQPLVVAWNRWSPTLIPDRIHIRGEEAKQRKAMDDAAATTLALMRQASADQHLQHFHHHPSNISSSAAAGGGIGGGRLGLTKPPMSRSASAPATSLMAGRG